jgi:ATP-dependent Lon protease
VSDESSLPILPLKNSVLLPFVTIPLSVARPASVAAVEAALASEDKLLAVFTQRNAGVDDPQRVDLFGLGTQAVIRRMRRGAEGLELLVQGTQRAELVEIQQSTPFLKARLRLSSAAVEQGPEVEALTREVLGQVARMQELAHPMSSVDLDALVSEFPDPLQLVYVLGAIGDLKPEHAQQLLEAPSNLAGLKIVHEALVQELHVLELQQQIAVRAGSEIKKEQRDYLLRRQLETIQEELGEKSPEEAEVAALRRRLQEATLPDKIRKEAETEMARLERTPAAAPDFQITRSHLELLLELPWTTETIDNFDLDGARRVLDEDHYGLTDVKERIVEHLAVMKLNPSAHAPILCFVGPPGVGKTSLDNRSVRTGAKVRAHELGRMHDEAGAPQDVHVRHARPDSAGDSTRRGSQSPRHAG